MNRLLLLSLILCSLSCACQDKKEASQENTPKSQAPAEAAPVLKDLTILSQVPAEATLFAVAASQEQLHPLLSQEQFQGLLHHLGAPELPIDLHRPIGLALIQESWVIYYSDLEGQWHHQELTTPIDGQSPLLRANDPASSLESEPMLTAALPKLRGSNLAVYFNFGAVYQRERERLDGIFKPMEQDVIARTLAHERSDELVQQRRITSALKKRIHSFDALHEAIDKVLIGVHIRSDSLALELIASLNSPGLDLPPCDLNEPPRFEDWPTAFIVSACTDDQALLEQLSLAFSVTRPELRALLSHESLPQEASDLRGDNIVFGLGWRWDPLVGELSLPEFEPVLALNASAAASQDTGWRQLVSRLQASPPERVVDASLEGLSIARDDLVGYRIKLIGNWWLAEAGPLWRDSTWHEPLSTDGQSNDAQVRLRWRALPEQPKEHTPRIPLPTRARAVCFGARAFPGVSPATRESLCQSIERYQKSARKLSGSAAKARAWLLTQLGEARLNIWIDGEQARGHGAIVFNDLSAAQLVEGWLNLAPPQQSQIDLDAQIAELEAAYEKVALEYTGSLLCVGAIAGRKGS